MVETLNTYNKFAEKYDEEYGIHLNAKTSILKNIRIGGKQ